MGSRALKISGSASYCSGSCYYVLLGNQITVDSYNAAILKWAKSSVNRLKIVSDFFFRGEDGARLHSNTEHIHSCIPYMD